MKTFVLIQHLFIILSIGFSLPSQAQWSEKKKIVKSDGGSDFEKSVAISGNQAVVGNSDANQAYIYAKDALGTWFETARLTPSDGEDADFGWAVAISGDQAVIGSYGAAYVFAKNASGSWREVTRLISSDFINGDGYGTAVAISGNQVIVGAPQHDHVPEEKGAAYVFAKNASGSWREITKLTVSDGEFEDWFGYSVSISSDQAVIGGYGAAYIFAKNASGMWHEITRLRPSDGDDSDTFGRSASISSDQAIVGSQNNKAYIYAKDASGTWHEITRLTPFDGLGILFGWSVSIAGNQVIVGDHRLESPDTEHYTGIAYIFEKDVSDIWQPVDRLFPSDANSNSFGSAVSITANQAIVKSNYYSRPRHGGAAYIYAVTTEPAYSNCPFTAFPGIGDSGNPLGLLDYLCFHIDIKTIATLNDCLYCQFDPCYNCPSPCLTCPAPFEKYGYAYEITFSYENPLEEAIEAPLGEQNYFARIEDAYAGQPEVFEPGYHENVFSVIAAPGQTIQWALTDAEGFTRKIEFQVPIDTQMEVYPNANDGIFQLKVNGMEEAQSGILSITDSNGELIRKEKVMLPYEKEVNISQYGKGIYFVKVATAQGMTTRKVMVK